MGLDDYGLHEIVWNAGDDCFSDCFTASPADADGRGISLAMKQNGAALDLTDAAVYLIWRHRATGKRGCEPFAAVDAAAGRFRVFYPAALQEAAGAVDAQCMVSWDDRSISTRAFVIRVEPVLVGGVESGDGFTLFLEAIKKYEEAAKLSHEAADEANAAAAAANEAAASTSQAEADVRAAAENGEFDGRDGADGADGKDGRDGASPSASVSQDGDAAILTVTDASGTTTAMVLQGPKGDAGETGPQGDAGEQGPRGEKGEAGERGPRGFQGEAGADGADGVSCTHFWGGSVLTVTSASGASSTDLRGPQGDKGEPGADGADGTAFAPAPPLSLAGGTLSIDLSSYATRQYVDQAVSSLANLEEEEF